MLEIGKSYNFHTQAPSILGTYISNAKCIGILDYTLANSYENIDLKFRQIFPLLPEGTSDTPESEIYYRLITESGEKIIMANLWIQQASIEIVEHISFKVTFDNASIQDISRVRDALNALGYTNYSINQL